MTGFRCITMSTAEAIAQAATIKKRIFSAVTESSFSGMVQRKRFKDTIIPHQNQKFSVLVEVVMKS
jgi:hypothetical protein